ncbi:UNVERIFIED_CONTAM: hypothetical protein K2H54_025183 [Gekko kuhli]
MVISSPAKQCQLPVDTDDVLTKEEQIYLLDKAKAICHRQINEQQGRVKDGNCSPEWDGIICWPESFPNELVAVPCPDYVYDFNHDGHAYRYCDVDGNWHLVPNVNKTWANYTECAMFFVPEQQKKEKEAFDRLHIIYTVGYSISLTSLVVAMFILCYFKRLHCTRNYIHLHLFASFICRATSIFVKDVVLYSSPIPEGPEKVHAEDWNAEALSLFWGPRKTQLAGCKLAVTIFLYFLATNHYWILVEGLYLHSLIFMAFLSNKSYLWALTLIGWDSFPQVLGPQCRTHEMDLPNPNLGSDSGKVCKESLGTGEKIAPKGHWEGVGILSKRKLLKSTLVLMPLFGVHYVVFMAIPYTDVSSILWQIQMHYEMFFNSLQGFFVAFIYCFCNGEVQAEVKKAHFRRNLVLDIKQKTRVTSTGGSCYYGGLVSHVTNSVSLSMAGWGTASATAVALPLGAKNWLLHLTPAAAVEYMPGFPTLPRCPSQEITQKAFEENLKALRGSLESEGSQSGFKKEVETML